MSLSSQGSSARFVLLTLAAGAFGIGTTEFAISGLLPGIAGDFRVSFTTAGWAATVYALGVFIGAPLLILLGRRIEQKHFMLALMGLFVVGNVLTAVSPAFAVVLAGRAVTALAHGAFIGIGSIIASHVVPENRKTSAIAFMFSGMTLATLIGTPVSSWIADGSSWRFAFVGIAGIGVVVFAGIAAFIPRSRSDDSFDISAEIRAFRSPRLLGAMLVTILGPAGFFTSITYIAPITLTVTGTPQGWLPIYLTVFGLGLFIGNIVGSRLADLNLMRLMLGSLAILTGTLVVFWLGAASVAVSMVAVFVMAAAGFATVSPIQRLVMEAAERAGGVNLAASVNIGMFNLGNAMGAWLGGLALTRLGDAGPNLAGAALSGVALLVAWVIRRQACRADR